MSQIYKSLAGGGGLPPDVATSYVEDTGTAVPAANVLRINGGTGISTVGSSNIVLISATTFGLAWFDTAINFFAQPQEGIFARAPLTITLPATGGITLGATILIYAATPSGVVIQTNTGQFIEIGNNTSVVGGTATSTATGNQVMLVFRAFDSTWHSFSSIGSWLIM